MRQSKKWSSFNCILDSRLDISLKSDEKPQPQLESECSHMYHFRYLLDTTFIKLNILQIETNVSQKVKVKMNKCQQNSSIVSPPFFQTSHNVATSPLLLVSEEGNVIAFRKFIFF